jgi:hypothetical protein
MTDHPEQLPQPAAALERLAEYYGTHDTSGEMEHGEWVEPQPMATTSLRLPAEVISQLKCDRSSNALPWVARRPRSRRSPNGSSASRELSPAARPQAIRRRRKAL